jgi:hypothetical protein
MISGWVSIEFDLALAQIGGRGIATSRHCHITRNSAVIYFLSAIRGAFMNQSTHQAIETLAERITNDVRPDEMEMIRDAARHSSGSEMRRDGDLLSFGSPQEMVLLFEVTKMVLTTLSQELAKILGSEVAKQIKERWSSTRVPALPEQKEDVQSLLSHYETALRKHGFDRQEARCAADCLSRQLLDNPNVIKALVAG